MPNDTATSEALESQEIDVHNPQLEAARSAKNTWEFEGREYAKYFVNRSGSVGMPIMHPSDTTKKIAVLGADFAWDDDPIFIDHLNLQIKDVKNPRADETIRKRVNLVQQNSRLFEETVQRGWLQKIQDGEFGPVQDRSRDQMLAYSQEIQSDLIDQWLGYFFIERYFPTGTDDIDALLTEPDGVFFKGKVGDFRNPAHVMVFEFNTPSPEARRSYENDTLIAAGNVEGGNQVTSFMVNNNAKLRFARKHLKNVQGASFAPEGVVEVETSDIRSLSDPLSDIEREQFKKMFNPNWMIRLAEELADCFSFKGK